MLKILVISALIVLSLSNQHLNTKYHQFLHGKEPFSQVKVKKIYEEYTSHFVGKSPYRFRVFEQTLKDIVKHNTEEHSWKQGINDFTDLTFEEFKESRLMEPQHCSATKRTKRNLLGEPA